MERKTEERVPIAIAMGLAADITALLLETGKFSSLKPAGSLRRSSETTDTIVLFGTADDPAGAIEAFTSLQQLEGVLEVDKDRARAIVAAALPGVRMDLIVTSADSAGSALQYHTGSLKHNEKLEERARRRGLGLSEHGIKNLKTGEIERFSTEEAFYQRQGLQYVPPEIREGRFEIEKAEAGEIPRLLELSDVKGELHVHTNWSDGKNTIEEMVSAARDRGYQYIGIADHSSGVSIQGGEGYRRQMLEIRKLNQRIDGIRILCGAEINVMPDGSLQTPDDVLAGMDFVIAAVHRNLGMPRAQMTRRIIKAVENPYVDILAHPTSRRVLPVAAGVETGPVDVDMEALFQAASEAGTILEIDSMPSRLDLNDAYACRARELGIKLIIDTDSHNTDSLRYVRYGVGIARRAWCRAEDVVNTRPLPELLQLLKRYNHAGNA